LPGAQTEASISFTAPVPVTLRDSDRAFILKTLESVGWLIGGANGAAATLGLKRTTLIAKMKKLGISRPVRQNDDGPGAQFLDTDYQTIQQ